MNKEIIWNLVNAGIAGCLVFFGAAVSGNITLQSMGIALFTGCVAALIQFKNYWAGEEQEYCSPKILKFL